MSQRTAIPVFFWSSVTLLALAGGGDDPVVVALPTIATQPAGLSVMQGQPAAFTVAAAGTDLSYQWRRAGADLAGANAASYNIAASALGYNGAAFNVRTCTGPQANNACVVSSDATLSINPITLNTAQLAGAAGNTDGIGAAARFNQPAWLSISPSGDLFVSSDAGDTVRKLTQAGVVTTAVGVAGEHAAVVLGANPRLRNARGVLALSSNQLLVVADNAVLNVTMP